MGLVIADAGPRFDVAGGAVSGQQRLTGLTGGGYVISWTGSDSSGMGIRAQVFDASDAKVGPEILVNTTIANNQSSPAITQLNNGGFVVTWQDASATLGDTSGSSVKGQVFGALGNKVGSEFLVNTNTAGDQSSPEVAGLAGGGFAVTWTDASGTLGDASGTSVKTQVFDNAGNKVGSESLVNTNTAQNQNQEQIAALTNGNFIVTWQDASGTLGDASGTSIKGQIVDASGNKVGSEFLVNTTTSNNQVTPFVAGLSGGGFVVAWTTSVGAFDSGIEGQIFNNAGNKVGTQFLTFVDNPNANAFRADGIIALSTGGFVISGLDFFSRGQFGFADAYDAGGHAIDGIVNLPGDSSYQLGALTNGTFVATWFGNFYAQHFKFEQGPVVANPIPDQSSPQDTAWTFQVPANTFFDPEGDPLTYTARTDSDQPIPTWLSFDPATRTFSGTPPLDATGTLGLKVTVSDGAGIASDTFAWTVTPTAFPASPGNVDEWIISPGGYWLASAGPGPHPAGSRVAAVADFTHDGTSDILWQNVTTGAVDLWKISTGAWAGSVDLGTHPGSGWQVAGAGDFNHDGTSDVFWLNPGTGQTDIWLLANGQWSASANPGPHPLGYQVAGIGDFNHDGHSDVLWFNPATGDVDEWNIVNGHWAGSNSLGSHPGSGWQIGGVADFNGDGTSDVFWNNPSAGATDIWFLQNGHWAASASPGNRPAGYQVAGIGDFNRDGHNDVLFFNPATGNVDEWQLHNGHWINSINLGSHPGSGWSIGGVGDFNSNGISDILWHQFV